MRWGRFKNICDLKEYLNIRNLQGGKTVYRTEGEYLTVQARMEEFMFLGLRMMRGVSEKRFETLFGKTMSQVYGKEVEKLISQGLLKRSEEDRDRLALTDRGIDVSNYVFEQFLL